MIWPYIIRAYSLGRRWRKRESPGRDAGVFSVVTCPDLSARGSGRPAKNLCPSELLADDGKGTVTSPVKKSRRSLGDEDNS